MQCLLQGHALREDRTTTGPDREAMATLSRTTSCESATSNQRSPTGSIDFDTQERAAITDVSVTPSPNSNPRPGPSLASTGRVPSHSLLSSQNAALPNRKSRFADVGTTGYNVGRASISMPPPATKPSSIYKPSAVRRPSAMHHTGMDIKEIEAGIDGTIEEGVLRDPIGLDDIERTISLSGSQRTSGSDQQIPSAVLDASLKPPTPNLTKPGDRLSFSSLYSLGSAIYNGAAGIASNPQSTASSTAGSIKGTVSEIPPNPPMRLSPTLGPGKGETASNPTTATDPVSVIANSQPLHQGSEILQTYSTK